MKHIIHLEDHSLFASSFYKAVLTKLDGIEYKYISHPDEALKYIKSRFENRSGLDIIITDFNHLGINGYHFARQVRMLEMYFGRHHTPIVLVSMVGIEYGQIQTGLNERLFTKYFPKSAQVTELLEYFNTLGIIDIPETIPLKEVMMPLNTKQPCKMEWIISRSTYCNLWEGTPDVESGVTAFEFLKKLSTQLTSCIHFYVFQEASIGNRVLPIRSNMAHIFNASREAIVIWFDNIEIEPVKYLEKMIDEVGFEKMTMEIWD
jgi:hypothetical protein